MTSFQERFGPWAVVTGASDGIGQEIAIELAARGLNLVLVARRLERLEALATNLTETHSVETLTLAADLAEQHERHKLVQATDVLDVGLIVPAAGFGTSGVFADADIAQEINMVHVNCIAVTDLVHAFVPKLLARGHGGLVFISSLVAFQGVARAANYAATKAYIQSLAEGLRLELGPHGIDVLSSAPATVRTGFAERANMNMSIAASANAVAKATVKAIGKRGTVRPGLAAYLLELSLKLPRWARARIMSQVMRSMTAHQS
ncbi:MAG: SDR family NAD(P)-dependent oxidoreductase [Deinococcota bacterium]